VLSGKATIAIGRRFSATNFWREAKQQKATAMGYVGEICRYLINQPKSLQDRNHNVKKMIGNGLRPAIWKDFKLRFGIDQVVELYGSSEGNIGFTNLLNFDNTVGFSPVNFALVKYDKETGEPLRNARGFMEKVARHGTGLMIGRIDELTPFDGYTSDENSEKVILRNVFEKGDAWFNSGDLLRDLGFHHAQFVDRLGDTFRWKGENVSTTELEGVVSSYQDVSECVAYGVEIPNTNGKAGMVTITLVDDTELDGGKFKRYLTEKLPHYAVPIFVRVTQSFATTGTFKYQKTDLKKQAYNPALTNDPLWILLPGETSYQPLTDKIYNALQLEKYRY
jgi:citronellyl-CoA synthetase